MSKGRFEPKALDRARDELFSHIRRCGVMDAEEDQRGEWFDDTIGYLGERYPELSGEEVHSLRLMGERYCAPAIRRVEIESTEPDPDDNDVIESSEVNVA